MLKIDWSLLDHCEQCRISKLEPCPEYRYWSRTLKNAKNFDFQHTDSQTKQHLSQLVLCHRTDYRELAEEQTNPPKSFKDLLTIHREHSFLQSLWRLFSLQSQSARNLLTTATLERICQTGLF